MRLGLRRVGVIVVLLAAVVVLAAAGTSGERSAARGPIDFRGNYETGDLSQWGQCHTQNRSRCGVTTRVVRQGRYAGRFTTSSADDPGGTERAENVADLGDKLGSSRYYAWSTMFPRGFRTPSWANFRQFGAGNTGITGCVQEHFFASYDPPSHGPANATYVEICAGDLSSGRTPPKRVFKIHQHLNLGRWNDYVLHVRWSYRRAGRLTVWHRVAGGRWRRAVDSHGPTAKYQRAQPVRMGTREGLYRSAAPTPATVYHDGFVSGDSFNAVVAAAFGSASR